MPFEQFKRDAAAGTLPDFAMIEPNLLAGHGDYHPAAGRAIIQGVDLPAADPPSSILSGEAFLEEIFTAYRGMASPTGANVYNTTLLIGWDEPGGTYDHVPPGPVPPPDPSAPAGQYGFTFDRSGYRVPAIVVSPWVARGSVFTREHRHTSLIATLREQWDLGEPFTERDKAAAPIDYVFTLDEPRSPDGWAVPVAAPVPPTLIDWEAGDKTLSNLGKAVLPGIIATAKAKGLALPPEVEDPNFHLTTWLAWDVQVYISARIWPQLGPQGAGMDQLRTWLKEDLRAATTPEDGAAGTT